MTLYAQQNKNIRKTWLLMSLFFLAFLFIFPAFVLAEEKIDSFSASLVLNKNGSILVTEDIRYNFGIDQRHGIFRDIPVKYELRLGLEKWSFRLSDISVVDENGVPYSFALSNYRGYKRIKIGDPDKLVSGAKRYVIRYTVRRAIAFFDDFDEIYWNITGNGWIVPMSNVSATVILPSDIKAEKVKYFCYRGLFGSSSPCDKTDSYKGVYRENNSDLINQIGFFVEFFENKLSPSEGLTVSVGFPKGIVREPSWWTGLLWFIRDNYALALPFLVLGFMFWLWYKKGRDPKGKGVIIAEYEPPLNLKPTLVGTLIDEKTHNRDITAGIIYLAEQGFLKIRKIEKGWFLGKGDYELELLKDFFSMPDNLEYTILEVIFGARAAVGAIKKLSELRKNKNFAKEIRNLQKMPMEELIKLGFMDKNSSILGWSVGLIALVICAIIIISWRIFHTDSIIFLSMMASILIVLIFSKFMDRKTKLGVETRDHILRFKEFLSVTEKDRLAFHNAPEKSPEHFMKYLTYAIALGVEKKWAVQFADIYISPPNWYEGNFTGAIVVNQLAGDLSGFTSAANSGFSTSSGGSGSGGGGFSGGGGGGGGGGSW